MQGRELTNSIPLPNAQEALSNIDDRMKGIHADGLEGFYDLRKKWSSWMIFWITFIITSVLVMSFLVGCSAFTFKNEQIFVQWLFGTTCVEIIGMGVLIVKFLFNKPKETQN